MPTLVSLFAAIVPSIILLRYFYKRDLNPEPRGVLIKTFLLGVLIVLPVALLSIPLHLTAVWIKHPLWFGFHMAFLCAAIPEECFKYLVVTRYSARNPAFDEPMDGIVYGAAASLGFAALENVMYVSRGGWPVALLRAFTAVPCHACLGAIMGYYIGLARFHPQRRGYARKGLMVAILLHGLYDWPVFALHGHVMFTRSLTSDAALGRLLLAYVGCLCVLVVAICWMRTAVLTLRMAQIRQAAHSLRN